MSFLFEELDTQDTAIGEISLRRRTEPRLNGQIIYEVKLGEEFLMSSLFPEAEIQLSRLGITALKKQFPQMPLDIIVGGLGLGYTAVAALEDGAVNAVQVIDVMPAVIDWHQRGLVPLGKTLSNDKRCTLFCGDFFDISTNGCSFYQDQPDRLAHAVLLDIDHSPSNWLAPENSTFSGGIFGLWSNDLPDAKFSELLNLVFDHSEAHTIPFLNPYTGGESTNSVYLAFKK